MYCTDRENDDCECDDFLGMTKSRSFTAVGLSVFLLAYCFGLVLPFRG